MQEPSRADSSPEAIFLGFSAQKLSQLTGRIEQCVAGLNEADIWNRHSDSENAVGNLLLHLSGNVRQWLISGVGGARDTRDRAGEFAARSGASRSELVEQLRGTVGEAVEVIRNVSAARLSERLTIQGYDVTVLEAVYHVVEHFSQHTGQIIFATKLLTGAGLGFYKHLDSAVHSEKQP
jgi:uncharacterized damage-inducible protein DinB